MSKEDKHFLRCAGRAHNHIKLLAYIPNKKELHITAHASTPVLAGRPVYPGKSLMC